MAWWLSAECQPCTFTSDTVQDIDKSLRYVYYFIPQYAFAMAIYNIQQYYYNKCVALSQAYSTVV